MGSEAQSPGEASQAQGPSGSLTDLKSQCECLQQRVRELEEAKSQDAEALLAARKELKEYEQLMYAWAGTQVREEDWKDFSEADYSISADEIIAELERQEG